jgi:superfamily II DNA or RNA helicase
VPEDSQLTVTKRHSRRILWRHVRRLDSIVPTEAQLELRPFQKEALAASLRRYGQGIRRQLIALPTGMGKTVIFANLREHHTMTKRTLGPAHK